MTEPVAPNAVVTALAACSVKLPLRLSDEDIGVILDDDGADVATVDSNGFRDDDQVRDIACLFVTAINHFAGLEEISHAAE